MNYSGVEHNTNYEKAWVNSDNIRKLDKKKMWENGGDNYSIDAPFVSDLRIHGPKAVVCGKTSKLEACRDKALQYGKCLELKTEVKVLVYRPVRRKS